MNLPAYLNVCGIFLLFVLFIFYICVILFKYCAIFALSAKNI